MKRILIFTFLLGISLSFRGFAQTLNYSANLPVDQTIKKVFW
ncbi:hypothetical protein [Confluentibacter sediminis]|nr:hypothetical protein [Confluentibacter sediminis]